MRMKEIEAQILGKNFNFNIPDTIQTEDFLEIIAFVKNKINKIRKEDDDLDSFQLGLLAAVNIAEEYFSLKKENEKLSVMLNKINKMVSPLEEDDKPSIHFSS